MVDLGPLGEYDHGAAAHGPRTPAHDPRRCGVCIEARRRARLHSPGTRRDLGDVHLGEVAHRVRKTAHAVGDLPFLTLAAVIAADVAGVALLVATGSVLRLLVLWAIGAAILAGGWQADRTARKRARPANAPSAEQPVPAPRPPDEALTPEWYRANGMPQAAAAAERLAALREEEAPEEVQPAPRGKAVRLVSSTKLGEGAIETADVHEAAARVARMHEVRDRMSEIAHFGCPADEGEFDRLRAEFEGLAAHARPTYRNAEAAAAEVRTWQVQCRCCGAPHTIARQGRDIAVQPATHHAMVRLMSGWEVRCPRGASYMWIAADGFEYRVVEPADLAEPFPTEEA